MLTVPQSRLGEAATLLEQAGGQTIVIVDGDREVGAIVSPQQLQDIKRASLARMDEISKVAEAEVERRAKELGISPEELVDQLLRDDDQ